MHFNNQHLIFFHHIFVVFHLANGKKISKVQLHFKIGELFIYNNALIVSHGNTTGTHKRQSQVGRHIPTT